MIDIELTAPAPVPGLNDVAGLGVIVRRCGIVQAFAMSRISPGESPAVVLDRLLVGTSETLLAAAVRRQLLPACQVLPERTLTVVICTKDRPDLLKRCLDAVVAVRPNWAEVLVVDNASRTAATCDIVAACGNARYVFEARSGSTLLATEHSPKPVLIGLPILTTMWSLTADISMVLRPLGLKILMQPR